MPSGHDQRRRHHRSTTDAAKRDRRSHVGAVLRPCSLRLRLSSAAAIPVFSASSCVARLRSSTDRDRPHSGGARSRRRVPVTVAVTVVVRVDVRRWPKRARDGSPTSRHPLDRASRSGRASRPRCRRWRRRLRRRRAPCADGRHEATDFICRHFAAHRSAPTPTAVGRARRQSSSAQWSRSTAGPSARDSSASTAASTAVLPRRDSLPASSSPSARPAGGSLRDARTTLPVSITRDRRRRRR